MTMTKQTLFLACLMAVLVNPGLPSFPQSFYKSSLSALMRFHDPQQSGSFHITSKLKVVGGTEARPHQFPYQVSIQVRNYFGGYDHNCGGVIYDKNHIITAAHCLRGYHPRNLKIIAGEHELFNDEGPEQYRDILGYVFHPNFEPYILDNDIGIITLDHPLDLNENVQPLRILNQPIGTPKSAQTSGWGSDGVSEGQQTKLLFVNLTVYSDEECIDAYKDTALITKGMICAGNQEGFKGSCSGDSGGPLICKEGGESGREYLCGLVSWGMIPCALPQFPTVFTKVSAYTDWLHALLPPQEL